MQPQVITDVDLTFGGRTDELLPLYKDIPEEFKRRNSKWNSIVSDWVFEGLPINTEFIPKDGIDAKIALRHVSAILHSYQPKHEHKEAGCAYLLSLWFDDIKYKITE